MFDVITPGMMLLDVRKCVCLPSRDAKIHLEIGTNITFIYK